ncbi:3D domain-containing protein [Oscillibacter sp.]|uniref:3D domain-containing protein n=1 Tax=Oscillibacter sp. TaxID=1945593 RepID=UPI00289AEB83|nr:3D domain-containing protein [Oscillibacter sp.]
MKRFFFGLLMAILAVLAAVALTTPVHSQEPTVITDKLAEPVGPAQCWEAPDFPEDYENEKIEAALLESANVIKNCTITFYAPCVECCGNDKGITASGLKATPGVTAAVDPILIPLGSDVLIDWGDGDLQYCRADDTGSGVTGAHIDLCVEDYQTAKDGGVKTATVYYVPVEEVEMD